MRLEPALQLASFPLTVGEEVIHAHVTLLEFYEGRLFTPAWSRQGALSPAAAEMVSAILGAGSHGLRPGDYHLAALERLLGELPRAAEAPLEDRNGFLVDLDLLLTDAFLVYSAHLVSGRVDPGTFDREWVAVRREVPLRPVLEAALTQGGSVREALAGLLPQQPGYERQRQDPGPQNALRKVKFMFPNEFNVYLHDTPAPELFARPERDQSSGCIRLEKPLELAALLLQEPAGSSAWNQATLEEVLATGRERTVRLPKPVPVHLLYWTAWVEVGTDGPIMQFRNDPYGRDRRLEAALAAAAPNAVSRSPVS